MGRPFICPKCNGSEIGFSFHCLLRQQEFTAVLPLYSNLNKHLIEPINCEEVAFWHVILNNFFLLTQWRQLHVPFFACWHFHLTLSLHRTFRHFFPLQFTIFLEMLVLCPNARSKPWLFAKTLGLCRIGPRFFDLLLEPG